MTRWAVAGLTVGLFAQSIAWSAPPSDASLIDTISTQVQRMHAFGVFDGAIVLARDGEIIWRGDYGLANRKEQIEFGPGTISTIGSITKQFTAAAIMALQEDGVLQVTDTLSDHFPDVPRDKSEITLHQLLTHTSGFEPALGGDASYIGRDDYLELAWASELLFDPGERFEYSNTGYSILAALVEKLRGTSYENFLRERFFDPLGMADTGYRMVRWDAARLAHGYRGDEHWGTILERQHNPTEFSWHLTGNGGIHSTIDDMLTWVTALRDGAVLTEQSTTAMFSPHAREGMDDGFFYGYGWGLIEVTPGEYSIGHNGGNEVFFADVRWYPMADGLTYLLMTNRGSAGERISEMVNALIAGETIELLPAPDQVDVAALRKAATEHARAYVEAYNQGADAVIRFGIDRRVDDYTDPKRQQRVRQQHAQMRADLGELKIRDGQPGGGLPNEGRLVVDADNGDILLFIVNTQWQPPYRVEQIAIDLIGRSIETEE